MAINPPSDIVLGSVLAADPARYRAAVDRLKRAAGDAGADPATFAALENLPENWPASTTQEVSTLDAATPPDAHSVTTTASLSGGREKKPPDAFGQLEAFVLQSFIQTMLPKNSSFFGSGTAGEIWKSMLAEKLGAQIASSGQVGLAKRLAAGRASSHTPANPAAALDTATRASTTLMNILPYLGSTTEDEASTGAIIPPVERS